MHSKAGWWLLVLQSVMGGGCCGGWLLWGVAVPSAQVRGVGGAGGPCSTPVRLAVSAHLCWDEVLELLAQSFPPSRSAVTC